MNLGLDIFAKRLQIKPFYFFCLAKKSIEIAVLV